MATTNLTESSVKRFRTRDGRVTWTDEEVPGLELRISPDGIKRWRVGYRLHGRRSFLPLGTWGPDGTGMSVKEARQAARAVKDKAAQGVDPQAERRASREGLTVGELLDEYERVRGAELRARGLQERMRALRRDLKLWTRRKVRDINRRDGTLMLDSVKKRGPVMANRLAAYVSALWSFAMDRGIVDASPFLRLTKRGNGTEKPRERALESGAEIKAAWDLFGTLEPAIGAALRFILVTGQRPEEVAGMRWDEITGEVWVLPPERRKAGGDAHTIPLSSLALEILAEARGFVDAADRPKKKKATKDGQPAARPRRKPRPQPSLFVFPSPRQTKKPVRRDGLSQALLEALRAPVDGDQTRLDPFTPHDLRRSCRTALARLGVDPVTAERVLGHSLAGTLGRVAAAYDRHDPLEAKRAALEAWSDELRRVLGLPMPVAAEGASSRARARVVPLTATPAGAR